MRGVYNSPPETAFFHRLDTRPPTFEQKEQHPKPYPSPVDGEVDRQLLPEPVVRAGNPNYLLPVFPAWAWYMETIRSQRHETGWVLHSLHCLPEVISPKPRLRVLLETKPG